MRKEMPGLIFACSAIVVPNSIPGAMAAVPLAYSPPLAFPTGTSPAGMVIADFNHDGKLDVAAALDFNSNISVLLAGGATGFLPYSSYATAGGWRSLAISQALIASDFNGDGLADLAVPGEYSPWYVSVFLGNSDGTFVAAPPAPAGTCPVAVAAADFNGDGKRDLVVANFESTNVSVLLGHGDGTFGPAQNFAVGSYQVAVAPADFNNDGKVDILVADRMPYGVSLLLGKGDGTFSAASFTTTGSGSSPNAIAIADLNGDGKPDAVVTNGNQTIAVLLGLGNDQFTPAVSYPTGLNSGSTSAVALADLDNDGRLDAAVADRFGATVSIFPGHGDGTFAAAVTIPAGDNPSSVAIADFNDDGRLDLAVLNYSTGKLSLLLNDQLFDSTFD